MARCIDVITGTCADGTTRNVRTIIHIDVDGTAIEEDIARLINDTCEDLLLQARDYYRRKEMQDD